MKNLNNNPMNDINNPSKGLGPKETVMKSITLNLVVAAMAIFTLALPNLALAEDCDPVAVRTNSVPNPLKDAYSTCEEAKDAVEWLTNASGSACTADDFPALKAKKAECDNPAAATAPAASAPATAPAAGTPAPATAPALDPDFDPAEVINRLISTFETARSDCQADAQSVTGAKADAKDEFELLEISSDGIGALDGAVGSVAAVPERCVRDANETIEKLRKLRAQLEDLELEPEWEPLDYDADSPPSLDKDSIYKVETNDGNEYIGLVEIGRDGTVRIFNASGTLLAGLPKAQVKEIYRRKELSAASLGNFHLSFRGIAGPNVVESNGIEGGGFTLMMGGLSYEHAINSKVPLHVGVELGWLKLHGGLHPERSELEERTFADESRFVVALSLKTGYNISEDLSILGGVSFYPTPLGFSAGAELRYQIAKHFGVNGGVNWMYMPTDVVGGYRWNRNDPVGEITLNTVNFGLGMYTNW